MRNNDRTLRIVLATVAAISLTSMGFASLSAAQTSGRAGSSVTVTRTPFLSIVGFPKSIAFPETGARATARDVFSNLNGNLPAANLVSFTDARGSGGFMLQAQASDFVSGENRIPASALKTVTTTAVDPAPSAATGNVFYIEPFTGPKTVSAPVNAPGAEFGAAATYGASLDTPVDLLNGCLPADQGRIGTMAVGLAFALQVPAYAVPGSYNATVTYTLTDFTPENCP